MRGFLLASLALAGCEEEGSGDVVYCDQYCDSDQRIAFEGGLTAEGEWRISASFDGESVTCTQIVPPPVVGSGGCDHPDASLDGVGDGEGVALHPAPQLRGDGGGRGVAIGAGHPGDREATGPQVGQGAITDGGRATEGVGLLRPQPGEPTTASCTAST